MHDELESYPGTIDERLPEAPSLEDVLDAAAAFACKAFEEMAAVPTPTAAIEASAGLRERMAASEAVGAILADLVTLRGQQRDGLGWLLEQVILAEGVRLRVERQKVTPESERAAYPVLQRWHDLATQDPDALDEMAAILEPAHPLAARDLERVSRNARLAGYFMELERVALRRERGRPTSPVRLVATAVDATFRSWPRGDRDYLAAALARDVLGAEETPEGIRQIMAVHRRTSQK